MNGIPFTQGFRFASPLPMFYRTFCALGQQIYHYQSHEHSEKVIKTSGKGYQNLPEKGPFYNKLIIVAIAGEAVTK